MAPKIGSVIDAFSELELLFRVVTESWLRDGKDLRDAISDLESGASLGLLTKNKKSRRKRIAGGGVAIAYDKSQINLKVIPVKVGDCEILVSSGKLGGISRKLVVIAAYIPPRTRIRCDSCLLYTSPSPRDRQKSRMPSSA